jgi:hypothetical protein
MLSSLLRPRAVFIALVVSLPFAGNGGCASRTACFQFSQPEFMVMNSCPAQSNALANFSDPNCPGPVVSVDGPGTFDGELCCYPVTYDSITPDCGSGNGGGSATGTFGTGFPGETTAVGTGFMSTSSGPSCGPSCASALMNGVAPCGGSAQSAYTDLQTCAGCFGGGFGGGGGAGGGGSSCTTTSDCFGNLCANIAIDGECSACLMTSCGTQLGACNAD